MGSSFPNFRDEHEKNIWVATNRIWIDSVDPVAFVLFWGLTIGEGHASIVHRTCKSKTIQFFWATFSQPCWWWAYCIHVDLPHDFFMNSKKIPFRSHFQKCSLFAPWFVKCRSMYCKIIWNGSTCTKPHNKNGRRYDRSSNANPRDPSTFDLQNAKYLGFNYHSQKVSQDP